MVDRIAANVFHRSLDQPVIGEVECLQLDRHALADLHYDADAIREEIEAASVEAVIPAKANRRNPVPHDRTKYKWRNLIERLFNKLENWRRVATGYDKTKESYLGFVALASIILWIPFVHEA
ncbi:MAG: transposase [Paracoccaceae bacterium]|uniref:transposase n=1 Tax=Hyphomonas sp. TaxID=87 RepID=UPI003294E489